MSDNRFFQDLDHIFDVLANQHRRKIVYLLSMQPYSISQLASIIHFSLPAIHKHIKLLENAGLIIRKKNGQTNFLALNRNSLLCLQDWVLQFHAYWGNDSESLENYTRFLSKEKKIRRSQS